MHPRTSGCPDRSPSPSSSTASGRRPRRRARSALAGSRRSPGGKPLGLPFQLHGHDRLGDPIGHGRHAEDSRAAPMSLLDLHRAHGRRNVRSRRHPIPDLVQVVLQIRLELRDRLPVHPGCALVRLDFLPRLPDRPLRNLKRLACYFQLAHATPPGQHPVDRTDQPRTTRPLRSGPITGPSSLLRTGPPARPATVLNPLRCRRLGRSLSPARTSRAYPGTPSPVPHGSRRPGSRRLHAGHHLARRRHTRQACPGIRLTPRFRCRLYLFRHVSNDSLAFVFLVPT